MTGRRGRRAGALLRARRGPALALIACLAILAFIGFGDPTAAGEADQGRSTREGLPEYHSVNGVLSATLEAAPTRVAIGDYAFDGATYNGVYGGPVLRAAPGDLLRINLVNHLAEPTNLHFHGMHTSPLNNGDNVFISVAPGESFVYEVRIPENQPPGLYWYHSHLHGNAERQVNQGLSGALIIDGLTRQIPALDGITERLFVLKDYANDDDENSLLQDYYHGLIRTIDGRSSVDIAMRPGETQLWRFTHQGAKFIAQLAAAGLRLRVIAVDGVAMTRAVPTEVLEIPPASRVEVLAEAGEPGAYELTGVKLMTGVDKNYSINRSLGRITVAGEPMAPPLDALAFPPRPDLSRSAIARTRVIELSQLNDDEHFFLNGKAFDHDRVDIRVPLGDVEEWTVRNKSSDAHMFHLHQTHFQVVETNGAPEPPLALLDNVKVPARGEVKIRVAFTESQIVGRFVYHCHVLLHEDKGMMGIIEVYRPTATGWLDRTLDNAGAWIARAAYLAEAKLLGLPASICRI